MLRNLAPPYPAGNHNYRICLNIHGQHHNLVSRLIGPVNLTPGR